MMCDRCCQCCWSKHFYKQYLEQHSAMMQWIHQGIQPYEGYVQTPNPAIIPCSHQGIQPYEGYLPNPTVPHHFHSFMNNETNQLHQDQEPLQRTDCNELIISNQKKRTRQFSSSSSVSSSEESDVSRDDIIGSDDEICFDPGCFLALRNNKESLSEKSDNDEDNEEEDFEMIDSVAEEFEYVQLDRFGNMSENRKGRKGRPQAEEEMKMEKEMREYFYGEKADTIAGLETAMSLDFNRLCDLHQPHLWPVLPVRLSKA